MKMNKGKSNTTTLFLISMLLIIAWIMLVAILTIVGLIVLPVVTGVGTLVVQVLRVGIGFVAIGAWIFLWKRLTEFWFYRVLLKPERDE